MQGCTSIDCESNARRPCHAFINIPTCTCTTHWMNSLSFHEWYKNSKQMYGFGRSFNSTNKPRYCEQRGRKRGYRNQTHGYWTQRQLFPDLWLQIQYWHYVFHNPAFTFHHITRENIRPLHAGQTEHRRRPSLHETQSGLSGERLKDIEKRLAPAIVVRFSDIRALKFFTLRSQNTQKRSNHFSYIQAESSNTSSLG